MKKLGILFIFLSLFSMVYAGEAKISADIHISMETAEELLLEVKLSGLSNQSQFLLNQNAVITDLWVNDKTDTHYQHHKGILDISHKDSIREIRLKYKFTLDANYILADSAIVLRNENKWIPYLENTPYEILLKTNISSQDYYLISAGKQQNINGITSFEIPYIGYPYFIMLPVKTYDLNRYIVKGKTFNFYESKQETDDKSSFYQEFFDSYDYFQSVFNDSIDHPLNIVPIGIDTNYIFMLCQSLQNTILYGGYYFYHLHKDNDALGASSWVPHEMAHQWWGVKLMCIDGEKCDKFLIESITEFIRSQYVLFKYGKNEYKQVKEQYKSMYFSYVNSNTELPIEKIKKTGNNQANDILLYCKGPYMLALIDSITNGKLTESIKSIYNKHKNSYIGFETFCSEAGELQKYLELLITTKGINEEPYLKQADK